MFERAQARMLPVVNRATDQAPMVAVCCNACRTCTTTNLLALAAAAGAGTIAVFARFGKRIASRF